MHNILTFTIILRQLRCAYLGPNFRHLGLLLQPLGIVAYVSNLTTVLLIGLLLQSSKVLNLTSPTDPELPGRVHRRVGLG